MRISDWSSDVCSSDLISVGVLLLVLGLARASWALTQRPRRVRHVGAIGPLVTAGHFLLYASMLLMPVAGLMLMLGKGYGLTVVGLQIGRAHVCTPVTNAHLVCRPLLAKLKQLL